MKLISKEWNPYNDSTEHWYWDDVNEKMTIKNTFDVSDVLKNNKAQANNSIDGRFGKEMIHHVAEIPVCFIVKFKEEHNLDVFSSDPTEQKRLLRLLEDPDYRFLKTTVSKLWRPT